MSSLFSNRRRLLLGATLLALLAGVVYRETAASPQRGEQLDQMRRNFSAQMEKQGLAAPFTGVMAPAGPERGLFEVRSTGVSTAPVRAAAESFLASLTADQRTRTTFPVGDDEWRKWANQDVYVRQGVSFVEMTEPQREKAFELMRASLSAKGLKQTRDIMRLNHTLGELNGDNFERYGEWRYHMTVMGQPSASEPWGWQFDGHHAVINYFVLGDQVVMSPFFAGSEPVVAHAGRFKGTIILQDEQNKGLAFVNALAEPQRAKAILSRDKTGPSNLTEAFKDNVVLDYQGVRATELTSSQRTQLLELAALHIGNMDDGHAKVKMEEVRRHLDRTTFAWIGNTRPDSVFYYRIHSPVVLIEFDHQGPVGLPAPNGSRLPNREHIHTVVRTPNGNDYGKDLLRQHYTQHPH
jgi:hypothetical protein